MTANSGKSRTIFITGTDTGVGKTVCTAAIALAMAGGGKRVGVLKPVQTGSGSGACLDIEFVSKAIPRDLKVELVCPYVLPEPLAPLTAARLAGVEIDLRRITGAHAELAGQCDVVIVEGAGGLLVPILPGYSMSDLASELGSELVIVSRPSLGTVNHTLLTVESARAASLKIIGVVISGFPAEPGPAESAGPGLITELGEVDIVGVLRYDAGIDVDTGLTGAICASARASLAPVLGGVFDSAEFLESLSARPPAA